MQIEFTFNSDFDYTYFSFFGKTFQKRSVSSPAPVTIVVPSGDIAKYNTLYVWPVKVAIFYIFGHFQTLISFSE